MERKTIIAIPTRGHDISATFLARLLDWSKAFEILLSMNRFSIAAAQETIFKTAHERNENVIAIDSDVTPAQNLLPNILQRKEEDIVCCPIYHYDPIGQDIHLDVCPLKVLKDLESGLYKEIRLYKPRNEGLERIYISSFSCMYVRWEALDTFVRAGESFTQWSSFLPESLNGRPSDNIFFAKASKLGLKAYVDWDLQGGTHSKIVDLSEGVLSSFIEKRLNSETTKFDEPNLTKNDSAQQTAH